MPSYSTIFEFKIPSANIVAKITSYDPLYMVNLLPISRFHCTHQPTWDVRFDDGLCKHIYSGTCIHVEHCIELVYLSSVPSLYALGKSINVFSSYTLHIGLADTSMAVVSADQFTYLQKSDSI